MYLRHFLSVLLLSCCASRAVAQIGEHRDDLAVGVSGGMVFNSVGFMPKVPQETHSGLTGGLTVRYTSEKYFSSICAIVAEVNYARLGWKEDILDKDDEPVVNASTGVAEAYQRHADYVQVPILARLGWGRERQGLQFFFQVGPQFGLLLKEEAQANFDVAHPNTAERASLISSSLDNMSGMYGMDIEHRFDYGIAGGLGLELSLRGVGHLLLEGRYYYGLADIYGNTKRDFFGRSNNTSMSVRLTYLVDLHRSK